MINTFFGIKVRMSGLWINR